MISEEGRWSVFGRQPDRGVFWGALVLAFVAVAVATWFAVSEGLGHGAVAPAASFAGQGAAGAGPGGGTAVGSAFPGVSSAQAAAGAQGLVVVRGEGVVKVQPDLAVITLGVETKAGTAVTAQAENAKTIERVINALTANRVSRDEIRTESIRLAPLARYDDKTRKSETYAYEASNTITVELKPPDRVGAVLDAAIAAGVTRLGGVGFRLSNENAWQKEALALAVMQAHARAEAIAKAAGRRLGDVVSITEEGLSIPEAWPDAGLGRETLTAGRATVPVLPGETEIRGAVQAAFALLPSERP